MPRFSAFASSIPSPLRFFFPMAELEAHQPFLLGGKPEHGFSKTKSLLLCSTKWVLKSLMWMFFIMWVAVIVFFPSQIVKNLLTKWIKLTEAWVFGITGSIFLLFSGPVLVIAFLGFIYICTFSREQFEKKKSKFPRFRLWTFPVLVDGPFGVVSAAELIGIILFSGYVIGSITAYTIDNFNKMSKSTLLPEEKSYMMLEDSGFRLGSIGLFCLAFLFLPVARGSILLRLIDIPFEHATRYHVWLGHLTMAIFTAHGLCYVISWALQGLLIDKMLEWKDIGIANLPGVISLLSGLLMWVTSLHSVRKNYFELFFYTHQLYVIFIVFLALHVGDFVFSIASGAIFLFILDRFLRFCQSRTTVKVISAACRPCGTVELILSKPSNLRYNALSFIFLQVRELSWLQWHPFSVSSSPLDGRNHLSILIKVLGEWTEKLRDIISNAPQQTTKDLSFQPYKITASVEGPYGHESPYHLMYENLILVAGGIGISPFLAILSDILHRVKEGKPCLPKNVLVVWAVKKSNELSLLSAVDGRLLFPSYSNKLHLDIQSYVTQESEPPLEDGKLDNGMISSFSVTKGSSMSSLVGTGNNVWSGIYVIASTIGFIIIYGLTEIYYIKPYNVTSWWYLGLIFLLCMIAGVVTLGGGIVFLWNQWGKRSSGNEKTMIDDENSNLGQYDELHYEASKANLESLQTKIYGCRPDFQAIFSSFSEHMGSVDVGVIVCGPPGLQSSVAKECRSQNIKGRWNQPVFHFNSHSFDL